MEKEEIKTGDAIVKILNEERPTLVKAWKDEIEGQGYHPSNLIHVFEKTLSEYRDKPSETLLLKLIWIIKTYWGNHFDLLRDWNDHLMNGHPDNDRDLNAATSQRKIINWLIDQHKIGIEDIERMQIKNRLRGKGGAKEENDIILNEAKEKITGEIAVTGFACKLLSQKTVEEIYKIMADHKPKPQIKGRLIDFKNIFAQNPTRVDEPITWQIITKIKGQNKTKANNTAFHAFLRLMLDYREKKLPRQILKQANELFICNGEPIFPNNQIKYPGSGNEKWMKSTITKHFSKISIIIKNRPK
jgi:hypothetical protein